MTKIKKEKPFGELVYGLHPIIEILKAKKRKLLAIYTTKPEPKGFALIEKLMPRYPVQIFHKQRDALAQMAGTTDHQSVIALVSPFIYRKKFFEPKSQPVLLMLDGIQDVRNLGAILRSAYCTGVNGVVITQKHSAPIAAATLKASAGLAEHLDIYLSPSAQAAVLQLKGAGYHIYITAFDGSNALKVKYQEPLCIIIGSEETGVSPSILCQGTQITIPQRSTDISYNASVAAGIMLFIISQRNSLSLDT